MTNMGAILKAIDYLDNALYRIDQQVIDIDVKIVVRQAIDVLVDSLTEADCNKDGVQIAEKYREEKRRYEIKALDDLWGRSKVSENQTRL